MDCLELCYQVLDKHFENWQNWENDYYLTELTYLLKNIFGIQKDRKTILKNLKESNVKEYKNELQAILKMEKDAVKFILDSRMEESRRLMCQTKYLGVKPRFEKFTSDFWNKVKNDYENGVTKQEIMQKYKISKQTLNSRIKRRNWRVKDGKS